MQKIVAMVRPHKLDDIKEALSEVGIQGATITEVRGFRGPGARSRTYRGTRYVDDLVPKVGLEIVVADSAVQTVVTVLEAAAKTGKAGDGTIFVVPVLDAVRIRTGERGPAAI
jgi:nitrogen regulatory protein P-II 1